MPLKRIPTPTQDSGNWGTILNDHLAQTQNPLNGAFNSFDQFSTRPTNLTADDSGKTYLYTQTGNWHEWSGSEWKVQNKSEINVKDYGAIGDGVADDSAAVQAVLNQNQNSNPSPTNGNGKNIFFPEGIYLMNVITKYNTCKITGAGNNSTYFKSFTAYGYAVSIGYNDAWNKVIIEDVCFLGDAALTRGGIRFGVNDTALLTPEGLPQVWIGGLNLHNCTFRDLNIGIYKPWGNIGNHFYDCSFYKCNYHIFVLGYFQVGSPYTEHAGADTITDCHFQLSQICSIYFDGGGANSTGNYVLTGCVFESNPGITFYVTNFASYGSFSGGLLFEHCWFEESVKDTNLRTLNGISYSPTVLVVLNSNINFENCNTTECNLTRSNLFYNNCSDGVTVGGTAVKDAKSSIIVSNLRLTTDSYKNFFTRDIIFERNPISENYTIITKTKPRSVISHSANNVLASESFAENSNLNIINAGGNFIANSSVRDGVIFDKCIEVSNFAGIYCFFDNYITIPLQADKYILWSIDARVASGTSFIVSLANSNGNAHSNEVLVSSKEWSSYIGMGLCTTAKNTGLRISTTTNTVARISAFQCLAFDTLQDMMNYVESGIFSTKQNIRSSGSEAIPTAGSWLKGDLIYNTNPAPSSFVGWICTVSGTPGTWKGFGLIES